MQLRSLSIEFAARLFDKNRPPLTDADLAKACVITTRKPKLVPRTHQFTLVVIPKQGRIRTITKTVGVR